MLSNLLIILAIGLIVGFAAGFFFKRRKHGFLVNIGAGLAGAYLGMWLFGLLELGLGIQTSHLIISGLLGALLVVITIAVSKR